MEEIELALRGTVLDRDAVTRMSEDRLDSAWAEPGTQLLRVTTDGRIAIRVVEDHPSLDLLHTFGERGPDHYYLGRVGGSALFCTVVEGDEADSLPEGGWRHPFSVGARLTSIEVETMMVALAITNWHTSMPFSARDGRPTAVAQGGWARLDDRGGEHFPRTDPAVIVLIEHEDRLLLGSNALWETGRFSLLAGFVEAGESAEQAVVREVQEESGVPVEDVRYVASQPWPFPRSLMLGFRAKLAAGADPDALTPDPAEISELRWFTRQQLLHPGPELHLPRSLSIARSLIDLWVSEGDSEQ